MIVILLFAGAWELAAGGWIHAKAWLAEQLIASAWAQTSRQGERVVPWPWADTWPVARLRVPRLGVSRYVLSGGSGRTLAFGPGWLEGTALPGGQGTSVISGHRDTHFRFLEWLVPGDRIIIQTPGAGEVEYAVTDLRIVHENAGRILEPAPQRQLSLVTCYPFDAIVPGGLWRYVVIAEAVNGIAERVEI